MRRYFPFVMVLWFISEFPRLSKAVVIVASVALLVGMYLSAVKP